MRNETEYQRIKRKNERWNARHAPRSSSSGWESQGAKRMYDAGQGMKKAGNEVMSFVFFLVVLAVIMAIGIAALSH